MAIHQCQQCGNSWERNTRGRPPKLCPDCSGTETPAITANPTSPVVARPVANSLPNDNQSIRADAGNRVTVGGVVIPQRKGSVTVTTHAVPTVTGTATVTANDDLMVSADDKMLATQLTNSVITVSREIYGTVMTETMRVSKVHEVKNDGKLKDGARVVVMIVDGAWRTVRVDDIVKVG